jgi:hypothetical protein
MAASSSSPVAPFLGYLTVFKSRLGGVNLVLSLTSFAYTPSITLAKKLTAQLSERVLLEVEDPANSHVLEYLLDKRLVGKDAPRSSGRYRDFTLAHTGSWQARDKHGELLPRIAVFRTDMWLADPRLPSTIGVPTPENAEEIIELSHQLGLLTRTKYSWTASAQLLVHMRESSRSFLEGLANPMMLGLDSAVFLRQLLRVDGLLLHHLLDAIMTNPARTIRRDSIALELPAIAARALADARRLRRPPPEITEGKRFVELLEGTAARRADSSRAPGVLEHRTSPRLEWLTDLGALSKAQLPRNAFEYVRSDDAGLLQLLMKEQADNGDVAASADEIALSYWRSAGHFRMQRTARSGLSGDAAILAGYRIMQRSVGPASISDVSFAACLLYEDLSVSHGTMTRHVVEWAARTNGVTVSGGRYTRGPELIHITPKVLAAE